MARVVDSISSDYFLSINHSWHHPSQWSYNQPSLFWLKSRSQCFRKNPLNGNSKTILLGSGCSTAAVECIPTDQELMGWNPLCIGIFIFSFFLYFSLTVVHPQIVPLRRLKTTDFNGKWSLATLCRSSTLISPISTRSAEVYTQSLFPVPYWPIVAQLKLLNMNCWFQRCWLNELLLLMPLPVLVSYKGTTKLERTKRVQAEII